MPTSLYSLSVESYLQSLGALHGVLTKGLEHTQQHSQDADALVTTRLVDDMLPLQFQVQSVYWHSLGAVKAVMSGEFGPPPKSEVKTFQGLIDQLADTSAQLQKIDPNELESFAGKTVIFKLGDREIPFTTENFILSFSLPNLYFHATTAYDILRIHGVPLGKRDYLGRLKTA